MYSYSNEGLLFSVLPSSATVWAISPALSSWIIFCFFSHFRPQAITCPHLYAFAQVLQKVRQEQLGHSPYIQSLEAALQAKDSSHSRLTQELLEAQHAKEKAKQVRGTERQ